MARRTGKTEKRTAMASRPMTWFFMPKPKKMKRQRHTIKPDIDNLIKFYMDAANTVLWQDDNCVCKVTASKVWGDSPGTVMHVETIERNNENI